MKHAALCATLLFALISTPLPAHSAAAPPPQAGSSTTNPSGPTLDVTMKFISDTLGGLGTVNYVVFARNSTNGQTWSNVNSYTITNIRADGASCYIGYHGKGMRDGGVVSDQDSGFYLKDVLSVNLESGPQFFSEQSAAGGNPNIITTGTNPTLTDVVVSRPNNVVNTFALLDATLAGRLARALNHAVELCGGGNKSPF